MRNARIKSNPNVDIIDSDEKLLEKITELLKDSRINYQTDSKMLQAIGGACIRIGMAAAHQTLEETTKEQEQLKHYLSKGRNHRILLDNFWIMQTRGDEDIILGDEYRVDSLTYSMNRANKIKIHTVKKILSDGVKIGIFKRIKSKKDKRLTTYEINVNDNMVDAYIGYVNTHLGITGNLFTHVLQGKWSSEVQEALFRKIGWWGTGETRLSIEQQNLLNSRYQEGSILKK
jgi:hypothetical protein